MTIVRRASPLRATGVSERCWHLVMVEGPEPGRRIRLGPAPLVIGRIEPADLVLRDTEVSRRHCAIAVHPLTGLVLTDFEATNGTFVDGRRVSGTVALPENAMLQVGRHLFRCEQLSAAEAAQVESFADELRRARDYVEALLPAPIARGPVRADWAFLPSAHLGGDAFGYQWLDERHFAFHLIDVSGHGPSAALHSASILNVLRNRSLAATPFEQPVAVVAGLNALFPMECHAGMCFTVWYGVFDRHSRQLDYCSAGHHPAYRVDAAGLTLTPLQTRNLLVGAMPEYRFKAGSASLAPGDRIYLFSDGAFEIRGDDGAEGHLDDLLVQLAVPSGSPAGRPASLLQNARWRAPARAFDDDFTLLCLEFG